MAAISPPWTPPQLPGLPQQRWGPEAHLREGAHPYWSVAAEEGHGAREGAWQAAAAHCALQAPAWASRKIGRSWEKPWEKAWKPWENRWFSGKKHENHWKNNETRMKKLWNKGKMVISKGFEEFCCGHGDKAWIERFFGEFTQKNVVGLQETVV